MGRQGQQPGTLPQRRALLLSTTTTVTVVAWGVLVFAAIDFGRQARDGSSRDWAFLAVATLGAVACMFLAIVLASRMQDMIRLSARSSTRPLPRSLQGRAQEPAPPPPDAQPPVSEAPVSGSASKSAAEPVQPAQPVAPRRAGKRAVRR